MVLADYIFIFAGALLIFMGISKLGFNTRKAQRMIRLIGEVPTRIVYIVIGVALIVMSITIDLS